MLQYKVIKKQAPMPEKDPLLNDIDFVNMYFKFKDIFDGINGVTMNSDIEACFLDPDNLAPEDLKKPTFVLQENNLVKIVKNNQFNIPVGGLISKFMLFTALRFDGDTFAAMSFVAYTIRKKNLPYIRVSCDYMKVITKENRWGAHNRILKSWTKDEIKQDHGKEILKMIYKYDDFTIYPCNTKFMPAYKNCYNLYSPFPHAPCKKEVTEDDIPISAILMKHIFGEQYELGLEYLKILYEMPKQILPILVLVSVERETGKTTFLNWMQMLFGENSVLISPQELTSNYNAGYAIKNIILIDETVLEKNTSIERLKSLATAKTLSVSQKYVSQYSVPFFGKIILCTNKEKNFMKIDREEIRFWVRKINVITGEKKVKIEDDLFNEIPKFLKYLNQLPPVDTSKSRMVFTKDEINTSELSDVKEESKSGLCKDIEIHISDFFSNNPETEFFEAIPDDIKKEWFIQNNSITLSYLRQVIRDEMKIPMQEMKKYQPFNRFEKTKSGTPFRFENPIKKETKEGTAAEQKHEF